MRPKRHTPRQAYGALPALSAQQTARIARRIEALGRERGLDSDRAIADAAGLSPGFMTTVRGGQTGPRLGTLLALMTAFDLSSLDELLGPPSAWLLLQDNVGAVLGNLDRAFERVVDELPPGTR